MLRGLCLVLGTEADADKRDCRPWQRSRSEDRKEKKNRLPVVPQWKMIPRFKTWLYVLFVFPVLSVSVEGRRWERKNLVSIAEHSKLCETQKCGSNVGWQKEFSCRVVFVGNLMPAQEDILFFCYQRINLLLWVCSALQIGLVSH